MVVQPNGSTQRLHTTAGKITDLVEVEGRSLVEGKVLLVEGKVLLVEGKVLLVEGIQRLVEGILAAGGTELLQGEVPSEGHLKQQAKNGTLLSWPGPWFNIKMSSYQYRKSHCGDKTVVRSSYLHNWISYTGKMSSLYWIGALGISS